MMKQQSNAPSQKQEQTKVITNQVPLKQEQSQIPAVKHQFRCKKCRKQLYSAIVHTSNDCSSVFIQQPDWLDINDLQNQLKFNCPKCKTKLGEVIFSGKKCSCGKWVTPAYQLLKAKVDQIKKLGLA